MPWEHRGARHTACSMCMCMCMYLYSAEVVCPCLRAHAYYCRAHIRGITHRYVLKTSNEASIKSEVAARKAIGWNRHGDFLLKVSSKPDTS